VPILEVWLQASATSDLRFARDSLQSSLPELGATLRHIGARAPSLYAAGFLDRGRSRKRAQAIIMLGSSYMARPTWLYLPGAILVLKDK